MRETIAHAMIDRILTGFEIDKDRAQITFMFTEGEPLVLKTSGDCCSATWIESVDDPEALKGRVLDVQEIPMPDLGNIATEHRESVEEVQYYGLKVTTENGRAVIDYRNDSNGYYGGSLEIYKYPRKTRLNTDA